MCIMFYRTNTGFVFLALILMMNFFFVDWLTNKCAFRCILDRTVAGGFYLGRPLTRCVQDTNLHGTLVQK